MSDRLADLLRQPTLLADGAMATNLFEVGLTPGVAPETWLSRHPERIAALHSAFVANGSDIILTCSFGANRFRLGPWNAQEEAFALNRRAAALARDVADRSDRIIAVAGSVGPTGLGVAPHGPLSIEAASEAFAEQIAGLKAGGADLVWVETMATIEEALAAARAAIACDLPFVVTASFERAGRTAAGVSPSAFRTAFEKSDPAPIAIGANCGAGLAETLTAGIELARNSRSPLALKANCGLPRLVDGRAVYDVAAEEMAAYARRAIDLGARIVGGCCGTTPALVMAMRKAIDAHGPDPQPTGR